MDKYIKDDEAVAAKEAENAKQDSRTSCIDNHCKTRTVYDGDNKEVYESK